MDALEMLKIDHERMKSLHDQFKSEKDKQQQLITLKSLSKELEVHTLIEETVFYPAFKNDPELRANH